MKLILHGTPNSRQREFFLSRARHTAYGGARGGGKSWAMRRKFVLLALRYPELNLLLLRRTLPELRENHIIPLQRELYGIAPIIQPSACSGSPTGRESNSVIATRRRMFTNIRGRNMQSSAWKKQRTLRKNKCVF